MPGDRAFSDGIAHACVQFSYEISVKKADLTSAPTRINSGKKTTTDPTGAKHFAGPVKQNETEWKKGSEMQHDFN